MLQINGTTLATPFRAALAYARLGYRVLPLAPGEKRPHPELVPRGLKEATRDSEVLRRWWGQEPEAGVGVLPPPSVLVLDIDAEEAWEGLVAEHPELRQAPRQRTPRGRHVFLRAPEGTELSASTARLRGVDVRGLGRAYVVAAPTRLPSGEYVWEVPLVPPEALPPVPEPLLVRLLPEPALPPELQPARLRGLAQGARTKRLEELLRWAAEQVAAAPVGMRHTTLLRYARLVGGHVHLGLDPAHAARVLAEAGMRAGLPDSEAARTAHDGLKYGQKAPLTLPDSRPTARGTKPETAQLLVELATTHAELWHDDREGRGWATIQIDGHKENWPVRSKRTRHWLAQLFFDARGAPPSARALDDALDIVEGRATLGGPRHPVYVRVAPAPDEIWLDLGRPDWQAVRITASGWEVRPPEVRFRRGPATGALPEPRRGSGGAALRDIFAPWELEEEPRALLIAWLLGTLSPGPYPVLILTGEQGSGKSTLARLLLQLVDPGDLGSLPRTSGELFLAATKNHVLAFDNVSTLPGWLSDDLCKLATGGTLRKRQLYTDDEEVFLPAKNPVILNGISDFATRQDLLDRSILLQLQGLEHHKPEAELWRDFESLRAHALGDLLDLASQALKNLPSVRAPNTRMADFARWAVAAEPGYARPDTFEKAFSDARWDALRASLEDDPVYLLLLKVLAQGRFEGSAGELLAKLNDLRHERPPPSWPLTPRAMSSWLKRAAPALRKLGVRVEPLPRKETKRGWVLERVSTPPAQPDPVNDAPPASSPTNQPEATDDEWDIPADRPPPPGEKWAKPWLELFSQTSSVGVEAFFSKSAVTIEVDGRVVRRLVVPKPNDLDNHLLPDGRRAATPSEWLRWWFNWIGKEYPNPKLGIKVYVGDRLVVHTRP